MTLTYENYEGALLFIALAAVFDFFDGFSARLLKAFSPIGADLDSLADVVSFGMAPGFMVFSFLTTAGSGFAFSGIPYIAFLIPVFSALRLAKFNIDTRQKSSFIGLPVPANGLFWATFIPSIHLSESNCLFYAISVIVLVAFFCILMISELPMFSLKFKRYNWKDNRLPYILILSTIALVCLFRLRGVCMSIILYILLSFGSYILKISNEKE
jgi:CDP-diacylglycerol--serine O-phosphatidyltransferase